MKCYPSHYTTTPKSTKLHTQKQISLLLHSAIVVYSSSRSWHKSY